MFPVPATFPYLFEVQGHSATVEKVRRWLATGPRGIDRHLAALGPLLSPRFAPDDLPWLLELVRGLERDGLVKISAGPPRKARVRLA